MTLMIPWRWALLFSSPPGVQELPQAGGPQEWDLDVGPRPSPSSLQRPPCRKPRHCRQLHGVLPEPPCLHSPCSPSPHGLRTHVTPQRGALSFPRCRPALQSPLSTPTPTPDHSGLSSCPSWIKSSKTPLLTPSYHSGLDSKAASSKRPPRHSPSASWSSSQHLSNPN